MVMISVKLMPQHVFNYVLSQLCFGGVIPGLHSHRGYSLRLSRNCEWDEVCTNVDIHTLVWELPDRYNSQKSRDNRELKINAFKWIINWNRVFEFLKRLFNLHSRTEWECNHSTLDNEASSRFLWLGTDLPICSWELLNETRTGRECDRQDDCTLHTLILVLYCLDENVNQA